MNARAAKPQKPRHIPILDEDWEWLEKAYGPGSESKMGVGPAIRFIVHKWVQAQRGIEQKIVDERSGQNAD